MGVEQWLVHSVWDREGTGSNPVSHTKQKVKVKMKTMNTKQQDDSQQILAGRLTGRASDFDSDLCWFESNSAN